MRFKPGQQVVCVNDKGIIGEAPYPKEGEFVTINKYSKRWKGNVFLKEYDMPVPVDGVVYTSGSFHESRFEPLMDISELTSILKSEEIEV